jgi:hypothetical protein
MIKFLLILIIVIIVRTPTPPQWFNSKNSHPKFKKNIIRKKGKYLKRKNELRDAIFKIE